MKIAGVATAVLLFWSGGAPAQDRAGDFDHYVLALSWNPSWCAAEGLARGAETCAPERDLGFVVHGLWPQRGEGWPEWCAAVTRDPTRAETAAMADVMGSGGLAWYQWRKHGRCSALAPEDYFALLREAAARFAPPPELRAPAADLRIDPQIVEDAFLAARPDLDDAEARTVCRGGRFVELRICLDPDLSPRACLGRAAQDCRERLVDLPAAP